MVFSFILALLATWRLTHFLVFEDGPGDICVKLRTALGDSFFGKVMDCFYCTSIWIAAFFSLFVTFNAKLLFLIWLAVSGGACIFQRINEPKEETE